jgi:hypothetical protein
LSFQCSALIKAAKIVAVADVHVACFKGIAQQSIDKKFVTVGIELPVLLLGGLGVHITLNILGDDACWEVGSVDLARRFSVAQDLLQEGHSFEQRCILDQAREIQVREQVAEVEFELGVQRAVKGPFERGLVELYLSHIPGNVSEAFGLQQGEGLLPDLRERRRIGDQRIEEQIEHLSGSLEIPGRFLHGLYGCDFGRDLGLLLIIVDQMNDGTR